VINRRVFVGDLVRLAALAAVVPNDWRVTWRPRLPNDPFLLGVASGDPTASGFTLWTRLAPRPLEPLGGMNGERAAVRWEVAHDDRFTRIVRRGTATATPELAGSVHVDVDGLEPNRWYFYRFIAGSATSETGRARTTPPGGATTPLGLIFASCQHYEQGLYTAYRHMAKEDADLTLHLGDYIYEGAPIPNLVRQHFSPFCIRLEDYRLRYAQYKMDEHLRAAHAARPWIVTWDDHEVSDNYAGLIDSDTTVTTGVMRARRAAAYQAWWEHEPVRVPASRDWSTLSITRTISWGALAQLWVLDTRQYRSDQACGDRLQQVPCGDWADPSRTLMGHAQEKWLLDGLTASRARWQVLANQVMMAPFDNLPGPGVRVSMDQWSGYPVARDRLLGEIAKRAPNRTVVLTGDIHSNWVNELRSTFAVPNAPAIGAEFVGTSIASGGDGSDRSWASDALLADNPHLKWQNAQRGYVSCVVSAVEWRADYRTVPFVTRPGAPIVTASRWHLRNGVAGIERT
jgi:alkaline phosphatase D